MNKNPNQSGLISLATRSEEERREIGRKGGQASGKAKQEKKLMKDILNILLDIPMKKGKAQSLESIRNMEELQKKNLDVKTAILMKQLEKALEGDIRSVLFIRDTIGEGTDNIQALQQEINNEANKEYMTELLNALNQVQIEGVDYEIDTNGNRIPLNNGQAEHQSANGKEDI